MSQITSYNSGGGGGGVVSVAGGHDINITGTATNPIVNVNNAITLGDLSPIAPTDYALIAYTGSIAIGNGVLRLPATSSLSDGIIYLGSTTISNYGEANIFIGESSGNATLSIPDAQFNCGFGDNTCNGLTTGFGNTLLGGEAGRFISSGSNNTAVGYSSLYDDNDNTGNSTGSNNIAVGSFAASALKSSESNNIIVGNNGVTGDNNIIRIGTQGSGDGQQDECFVAGIVGVTTSNSQMVTIDSTSGQLGVAALPSGGTSTFSTDSGSATPSAGTITISGGLNTTTSGATSVVTVAASQAQYLTNYSVANASPYVVTAADFYITVDTSTIPITIQLPDAPTIYRRFVVKDSAGNASVQNVTVTTVSGVKFIDGATTFVMNTNYQSAEFAYDNFGYQIF